MTKPLPAKNQLTLLLCSVLLCTAATVFAVAADALHVLILVAVGMLGSHLVRRPLEKTTRSMVYSATFVAVLVVLQEQVLPVAANKFFLLPAHLLCPAVLYAAVAMTYFEGHAGNLCSVISFTLLGLMMAGNRFDHLAGKDSMAATVNTVHGFRNFFALGVVVVTVAMLALLRRVEPRLRRPPVGRRWRAWRWGVGAAALLAVVGGAAVLGGGAHVYERWLSHVFMSLLDQYMARQFSWVVFGKDVDLWRTVPYGAGRNNAIVLRARSPQAPGYLRGRAYTTYGNGHWKESGEGRPMESQVPGGRLAYAIFHRHPPTVDRGAAILAAAAAPTTPDPAATTAPEVFADILVAGNFRSDTLLAPGDADEFRVVAKDVREDANGTLLPDEWEQRSSYAFNFHTAAAYSLPLLDHSSAARYLVVPKELKPELAQIVRELTPRGGPPLATPARIKQLTRLLEERWQYALGIPRRPDRDPVLQFLFDDRRGHCELFATAAVMLLRMQGIPARYVTGFVCLERHPSGGYWVSRLTDAHAWAEAYVVEESRWVLVEATPAGGVPDGRPGFDRLSAAFDRLVFWLQEGFTFLKRGHAAEWIVTSVAAAWAAVMRFVWDPVHGLLTLSVLAVLLGFAYRRWLTAETRAGHRTPEDRARAALERQWRRAENALARRGLRRAPAWTLREFAGHIRHHRRLPGARRFVHLLATYEQLRYRATAPSTAELRDFTTAVTQTLRRS